MKNFLLHYLRSHHPTRWGPLLTGILIVVVVVLGGLSLHQQRQIRRLQERSQRGPSPAFVNAQLTHHLPAAGTAHVPQEPWESQVAERFAGGVCLIQGEYMFVDPQTEKPLRYLDDTPQKQNVVYREALSSTASNDAVATSERYSLSINGQGAPLVIHYTGTGFLIDKEGIIATNKHVAGPWEATAEYQHVLAAGYVVRRCLFRAFFAGYPEPFDLDILQQAERDDIALLKISLNNADIPVLPCERDPERLRVGQTVMLLGYPTGFDALLARMSGEELDAIVGQEGVGLDVLGRNMALHGLIQPVATRGMCGRVGPGRIVYDAPTAVGGSGSPVMTEYGTVAAINTALLKGFSGSNFGIPIQKAMNLVEAAKNGKK